MQTTQSAIMNQFCDDRASLLGASRFFHNPSVSLEALIAATTQSSSELVAGRHVLAIQDTTEVCVNHLKGKLKVNDGHIGPLTDEHSIGFFLHPSLVIDAQSHFPLGFSAIKLWSRPFEMPNKHSRGYTQLPLEEKESVRWLEGYQQSQASLTQADQVTVVADREADIYEVLSERIEKTNWLVRIRADRTLAKESLKLFERLAIGPPAGRIGVEIKHHSWRQNRIAQLEVRYTSVCLACPQNKKKQAPPTLSGYAIEVRELAHSVPEGEEAILWRLFTTHQVEDLPSALQMITWYTLRWQIEQLFRLLKTKGLQLQSSQLSMGLAWQKLTMMALGVALQSMQLVQEREGQNGYAAHIIFSKQEEQFLYALANQYATPANPHAPGSLAWASWLVARLGNWKGYPTQSLPGVITMIKGLEAFHQRYQGWLLAQGLSP